MQLYMYFYEAIFPVSYIIIKKGNSLALFSQESSNYLYFSMLHQMTINILHNKTHYVLLAGKICMNNVSKLKEFSQTIVFTFYSIVSQQKSWVGLILVIYLSILIKHIMCIVSIIPYILLFLQMCSLSSLSFVSSDMLAIQSIILHSLLYYIYSLNKHFCFLYIKIIVQRLDQAFSLFHML